LNFFPGPEAFDEFKMMTDVQNSLKVLGEIQTQKSVLLIEGILIFAFRFATRCRLRASN